MESSPKLATRTLPRETKCGFSPTGGAFTTYPLNYAQKFQFPPWGPHAAPPSYAYVQQL